MKFLVLIIACFLTLSAACTPRNAGKLTLVNSGVETVNVAVDSRTFTIRPSNHLTKDVSAGGHLIKVNDEPAIEAVIKKGKTTLFDSTGLSCYVIIDYAQRIKGEKPQIIDRIVEQRLYTTSKPMIAVLGSKLPKRLPPLDVLRIQQVDCEIVNDNTALIEELGNLP